tara:strand:+ start:338 stop:487 length:150 start_codon:yes stop_codon:yes gene_type:complete
MIMKKKKISTTPCPFLLFADIEKQGKVQQYAKKEKPTYPDLRGREFQFP